MVEGFKNTEVGIIPSDWEVKKIKDIAPLQRGFDLTNSQLRNGNYPVVYSNGIENYHVKCQAKGPGVVTGRSGTIGNVHFIKEDYWPHNTSLWVTDFKGNDPLFIYYLFVSINLNRFGTGSGVPTLNRNDVHDYRVAIPNLAEQAAIALALSEVEGLITQLEKLIAKKRMIKQGAMQELLKPKKGWEVKKLGEIGECIRGVSYNGEKDLFPFDTDNTNRLFRANNIQEYKIIYTDVQYVHNGSVKLTQQMQTNDILICMANGSKALVGKAAKYKKMDSFQYTFGAFMGCFRTHSKAADPDFIFYNFLSHNYRSYIEMLLSGSSINNLKPSDIESIQIPFPKKEIQAKISQTLSDMDAEIESLEKKLEKYKMLKQGMMQNLLTGKIRLV